MSLQKAILLRLPRPHTAVQLSAVLDAVRKLVATERARDDMHAAMTSGLRQYAVATVLDSHLRAARRPQLSQAARIRCYDPQDRGYHHCYFLYPARMLQKQGQTVPRHLLLQQHVSHGKHRALPSEPTRPERITIAASTHNAR
jgi:hypothetical protein